MHRTDMLLSGVLVTLESSHHVFEALDAIEELSEPFIKCETIPAPREITSTCGVALLCAHPDSPLWAGSRAYIQYEYSFQNSNQQNSNQQNSNQQNSNQLEPDFKGLKKNDNRYKIENSVNLILDIILNLNIPNREIYTVNLDFINKRKFYDQKT